MKHERIENDPLKLEQLEAQLSFFQPHQNLLDDIQSYIAEQHEEEDSEGYEEQSDESDLEEDEELELETTEVKDIKEFIKVNDQ